MSLEIQKFSQKVDVEYEVLHYSKFMNEGELREFIEVYNKLLIKYTQNHVCGIELTKKYDFNLKQINESLSIKQSTSGDYDELWGVNCGSYILFSGEEYCGGVSILNEKAFSELNLTKEK